MGVRHCCQRVRHYPRDFMVAFVLILDLSCVTSQPNVTMNFNTIAPNYNGWPLAIGGADLSSSCTARGFVPQSSLKFQWRFNGTNFSSTTLAASAAGSATANTVIQSPGRKNVGWYSCGVSSGNTSIQSSPVFLNVAYIEATSQVVNSEAVQGQSVTLECSVISFPPDPIYSWYRGPSVSSPIILGQSSPVLVIANLTRFNAGNYMCRASNSYASVQVIFGATVITPPLIRKVNTTFVTVGNTLQLNCSADSVRPPYYSWRSGNKSITNTSRIVLSSGSGLLVVRQVSYNDSGVYTCVVNNSAGQDAADFNVVVQGPPSVDVPGMGVVIAPEGSSSSLVCSWTAVPTPQVIWSFVGSTAVSVDVPGSRYTSPYIGTLSIGQVGVADEGTYLCSFSNVLGNATGTIKLFVIEIPTGLVVSSVGGHTLELRWNSARSKTLAEYYTLEYGAFNNSSFKSLTFPGNSTTGTLTGLSGGTTYFLRLKAVKLGVEGPPGNQITATTITTAPVLSLISANPLGDGRSLRVRWYISDTGGLSIEFINVTVKVNSTVVQTFKTHSSSGEDCVISGLMPTTSYTVEVSAGNAVGVSTVTSSFLTPLAPPATPTKPSIVNKTSHSISMKTAINYIGSAPIQFILINVSELHSGQSQVKNISINDSSMDLSYNITTETLGITVQVEEAAGHLVPYEIYTFAVAAQSNAGTSSFSEPTDPTSLEWDYLLYVIAGGTGGIVSLIIVILMCCLICACLKACLKKSKARRKLTIEPQISYEHKEPSIGYSSSLPVRDYTTTGHNSRPPSAMQLPSYSSCELHRDSTATPTPHKSPIYCRGTVGIASDSPNYPPDWESGFNYAVTHSAHTSRDLLHRINSTGQCSSLHSGIGSVSDMKASLSYGTKLDHFEMETSYNSSSTKDNSYISDTIERHKSRYITDV